MSKKLSILWSILLVVMLFMFIGYTIGFILITATPNYPDWVIYSSGGCLVLVFIIIARILQRLDVSMIGG